MIEPKAGWLHAVLTCSAGRTARPAVLIPGTPDVAELQMQGKQFPGIYFILTVCLGGKTSGKSQKSQSPEFADGHQLPH